MSPRCRKAQARLDALQLLLQLRDAPLAVLDHLGRDVQSHAAAGRFEAFDGFLLGANFFLEILSFPQDCLSPPGVLVEPRPVQEVGGSFLPRNEILDGQRHSRRGPERLVRVDEVNELHRPGQRWVLVVNPSMPRAVAANPLASV